MKRLRLPLHLDRPERIRTNARINRATKCHLQALPPSWRQGYELVRTFPTDQLYGLGNGLLRRASLSQGDGGLSRKSCGGETGRRRPEIDINPVLCWPFVSSSVSRAWRSGVR